MNKRQFTNRLKGILEHNAIERPNEREKSGLLNQKRIALAGVTERVFKKRGDTKDQERNYAISILMDASGSMGSMDVGDKLHAAHHAVKELAEVLTQLKGVEFEIAQFSATDIILKTFDQQFSAEMLESYGNSMPTDYWVNSTTKDVYDVPGGADTTDLTNKGYSHEYSQNFRGDNHDSLMVYRAYKRLLNRKGKKILLVLSDGKPTQGTIVNAVKDNKTIRGDVYAAKLFKDYYSEAALRTVTKKIKKEKKVIMLGVGILDESVENFYPHVTVIHETSEFFEKLTSLLAKQIKKV